jgi:hypothetical protein
MNGKLDDKPLAPIRDGAQRGRANLRLIRGEQPDREPRVPANPAGRHPAKQGIQRSWDDDDDPGPTAA